MIVPWHYLLRVRRSALAPARAGLCTCVTRRSTIDVRDMMNISLVPRPHPLRCEGKGSGDFGPFSWFGRPALGHGPGTRADTAALEQSSDLIGQQCHVGDSNWFRLVRY